MPLSSPKKPLSDPSTLGHIVVGAGRWGTWLARRLNQLDYTVAAIVGTSKQAGLLARELGCTHQVELAASEHCLIWLCLPDTILPGFAETHKYALEQSAGVIHSSGTAELLAGNFRSAVVWPIQSISLGLEPNWAELPLVIESRNEAFAKTLFALMVPFGDGRPQIIADTADRQRLHLAATLTQNFGNLLWTLAAELLGEHQIDYRALISLNRQHLNALGQLEPKQLQTGAAARGDIATLSRHESLLSEHPESLGLYRALSAEIQRRVAKPSN